MNATAGVTTIIPSYNCAKYVAQAVASALAQTRPPEEILVVDDGSTDSTRQVLEPYRGRIRYLYQENRGAAAARNIGIRAASGEFVAFLDADDLWLPQKLELQIDYFHRHPDCGLVYSDMTVFDDSGIIHESVKQWYRMIMPVGYVFPQLFRETLFVPAAVLCRRACFDAVGMFDEALEVGEDYEMWLRLARKFEFGYVDQALAMYRQHPSQATRTLGQVLIDGMPPEVHALRKILDLYPEAVAELGKIAVRRRLSQPYFALGYQAMASGDHRRARRLSLEALRRWPSNPRYLFLFLGTFLTPPQLAKARALYRRVSASRERRGKSSQPAGQAPGAAPGGEAGPPANAKESSA